MVVVTGTLFVLMKDPSPKQKLLEALSDKQTGDEEVEELIQQLQTQSPVKQAAGSPKTQGKWRLLWSQQASANMATVPALCDVLLLLKVTTRC